MLSRALVFPLLLALPTALLASSACKPAHPRNDWRVPAGAVTSCTKDDDCPSEECEIPSGQSRGTCAPVDLVGAETDGGAGPDADAGPARRPRPPRAPGSRPGSPGSPGSRPPGSRQPPPSPTVQPQPGDIQL